MVWTSTMGPSVTGLERADAVMPSLIDRLRDDEIASIRSEVAAGRRDHILKSLDERGRAQELVRQQYSGRYPFELLQNANDAAGDAERAGRARFVLTDTAVIVADNGAGFGEDQIRAICGLGRSSKDPRKSVGYKGLGFKSVGEITAQPQILSNGVSFQFDDLRVRESVEHAAGALGEGQRLPVYAFPFPVGQRELGRDVDIVEEARRDGFTTVMRLPLKPEVSRLDVERHLVESLVPRLLLFLMSIEELELRGTGTDFVSVISRDVGPVSEEVLLETNGDVEHWMVYREWNAVDRDLVTPLGDAWAEVERVQVAVAVPLDAAGAPSTDRQFPLHVYFPTEERTGLPVIVHGDFALQLDRRQLATSPETVPYNEHLIQTAATFFASTVAADLAARFPGTAASAVAVTPRAAATGLGAVCVEKCASALRGVRFLAAVDGKPRLPAEALLLPSGVSDPDRAHRYLDLGGHARVLVPAIESDMVIREFLQTTLEVEEWPLDETLSHLRLPDQGEDQGFYEMLVDWAEGHGRRTFVDVLASAPCVRTTTGAVMAPADKVFFPRRRDDVAIPADLPVPIALLPEVDGLHALLDDAGLQDFEWRELMRDYLLPILTDPETDANLRASATNGLRAYYESQRTGDPVLQRRIRDTLLEARTADGDVIGLRPAGEIYFGSDWTGNESLERIYGPFNQAEFLAAQPPNDGDQRADEMTFLSWVGVAGHPRVIEVRAEQRDTYMTHGLRRHPHRNLGQVWDDWWASPGVDAARRCEQGHPESQQLRMSYALDRLAELAATQDRGRLQLLWEELASRWGEVYAPATRAVFHCQNTGHNGERDRIAPSLLRHVLTRLPWMPGLKGEDQAFVRPADAWRVAFDTPRWVVRRVPILDPRLTAVDGGVALAVALGVTDAARPRVQDLVALLVGLADEHAASKESTRELHRAARWAMRTLNDV